MTPLRSDRGRVASAVRYAAGAALIAGALLFLLAVFDPIVIIPSDGVEWGFWLSVSAALVILVAGSDRQRFQEHMATQSRFMRWFAIIVGLPLVLLTIGAGYWFGWHYLGVHLAERGEVEMSLARFERSGRSQGIELAEPMLFFDRIPYLPDDRKWDQMVGSRVCLEGRRTARAISVSSLRLSARTGEGVSECRPPFDGPTLVFDPPGRAQ